MNYDLKTDLEFRPLKQVVEILWISGPTWHNAVLIAQRLNITVETVNALLPK